MRELLQMALDALESTATIVDSYYIERGKQYTPECDAAITALRSALAAPMPEPVAWAMLRADGLILDVIAPEEHESYAGQYTVPLYAAPPAAPAPAVPLTDDMVEAEFVSRGDDKGQGLHPYWKDAFRDGFNFARSQLSAAPVVPDETRKMP